MSLKFIFQSSQALKLYLKKQKQNYLVSGAWRNTLEIQKSRNFINKYLMCNH